MYFPTLGNIAACSAIDAIIPDGGFLSLPKL